MNLKRIMPLVLDWTTREGDDYLNAGKLVNDIIGQWNMYAYHVLTNVGGIYLNNTVYGEAAQSYVFVPKSMQKKSVKFLIDQVVTFPEWLFKNEVYNYVYPVKEAPTGYREYNPFATYKNIQSYIFWDLLNNDRMDRMIANEVQNGKKAYSATEMMDDLFNAIFADTMTGHSLTIEQRATQKAFIDALIIAADRNEVSKEKKGLASADTNFASEQIFSGPQRASEAVSVKRGVLLRIEQLLKGKKNSADQATKYHYEDMLLRIDKSLR